MQIGGQGIENLLANMVLEKKNFRKTQLHASLLWEHVKQF
jgi:hypothetical protein